MSQNLDFSGARGEMPGISNEPGKKRCIDDIIEHMTADLQSYEGQYILLGSPPASGPTVWTPPQPQGVYYQPVRDNNEMMMMDVGGGKYVNLVFKPGTQEYNQPPMSFIHYQQPQNLVQPHIIDYSQRGYNESLPNGCLIENVVGNWVPNRTGTYSPFPGVSQEDVPTLQQQQINQQPSPAPAPVKKQRIVAEVKPMRPSYSDVLAKSPPLTPPPTAKTASKPVTSPPIPSVKSEPKKPQTKPNSIPNGKINSNLKRESSNGSNEALAEKARAAIRRWLSQEFEPPVKQDMKKEKKKKSKQAKQVVEKEEKVETQAKEPEATKVTNRKENCNPTSQPKPQVSERPQVKPKNRERDERKGSSSKSERGASTRTTKAKRSQRSCRKKESHLGALCRKWQEQSSYYLFLLTSWLINLLWDVTAMSATLLVHMFGEVMSACKAWAQCARLRGPSLLGGWRRKKTPDPPPPPLPGSLQHNISLPTTGDEAMKRLLSCKGKDPYSILGVTSTCTDEEIKKYYKSQALLVHPDKNSQPGAEEAFKILVHAFDLIAEPEKRAAYDRYVAETNQVEQAWSELSDLISQLHEKMEYAANTIRCNNCGKRHKREITDRPSYAARYCAQCKIHHSVKEGDMWAESRGWGWWSCRYYACMEGSVYDITQWAHCQGPTVQRVKPDSHTVQYRVLVGRPPHSNPPPEPDFEDLLNSLYSQNGSGRGKKRSKKNK
ncbi:unnamed protein product [Nezara viridula]|uniref:J domain-containing protein n=1 Tax=Nezara viridula TaxID=85310 RepID=A0A9P0H5D9_NEZVI|nr:unnamed protein product [Nezara viridula]